MYSIDLIDKILVDQDPERLIDPVYNNTDEYRSEAEKIYNRIMTENKIHLIDIVSTVVFVFYESFGSWSNEYGDFGYDSKYLTESKLDRLETVGMMIFNLAQE
jgi:hypothetical protein